MNDTQLQPLNTSCDGASYLSICPHTYSFLSSLCSLDSWVHFSSVQSLSRVWLFATSRTAACQSLLKFMSIESVMLSKHLILSCPLLLLPSIVPSIRVFSKESVLHIRWPKYWSFSFNISPSDEYSGLISFRMDWLYLFAVQGTLKSLSNTTVQKHQFFCAPLSL